MFENNKVLLKNIAEILLVFILLLLLTGCSIAGVETISDPKPQSMFVMIESSMGGTVYYHKDTKVMYIQGNNGNITVMVDEKGKPLLWKGE